MADIRIVGKRGSRACAAIREGAGINTFTKATKSADAIVNYGLAGDRLEKFLRTYPRAQQIPMLNKYVGCSKLKAVQDAEHSGILVPESRLELPKKTKIGDWIEKRIHSSQGRGIQQATHRARIPGKYYQKMISDRKYELRVHAFLWLPQNEWRLNKRIGPADQIAWNFHQGGHFLVVRYPNDYKVFLDAKEISVKILEQRNMAFGAVDLIVERSGNIYFIEVNASPGFEELNQAYYCNAFRALRELPARKVRSFCN